MQSGMQRTLGNRTGAAYQKELPRFLTENIQLQKINQKNIIKNSDIDVTERMKYNYVKWAKESLVDTEQNGSTKTKFFNNFIRLEKLLFNITGIKTNIEFIQGIPKIDSLKY